MPGSISKSDRPVGRPPKPLHELRSQVVEVNFTPAEIEKVRELAAARSLQPSVFVRLSALGRKALPPPVVNVEFRKAWADLGHLLSNFNQVAKHLNETHSTPDVIQLREQLSSISAGVDTLRLALLSPPVETPSE